jgi:hypothetical protein
LKRPATCGSAKIRSASTASPSNLPSSRFLPNRRHSGSRNRPERRANFCASESFAGTSNRTLITRSPSGKVVRIPLAPVTLIRICIAPVSSRVNKELAFPPRDGTHHEECPSSPASTRLTRPKGHAPARPDERVARAAIPRTPQREPLSLAFSGSSYAGAARRRAPARRARLPCRWARSTPRKSALGSRGRRPGCEGDLDKPARDGRHQYRPSSVDDHSNRSGLRCRFTGRGKMTRARPRWALIPH